MLSGKFGRVVNKFHIHLFGYIFLEQQTVAIFSDKKLALKLIFRFIFIGSFVLIMKFSWPMYEIGTGLG